MDDMLYEKCAVCRGWGRLNLDGSEYSPGTRTATRPCVCVRSPTPGYTPTGLTTGQVERMVDKERAVQGDPGIPAGRRLAILRAMQHDAAQAIIRLESEAARP